MTEVIALLNVKLLVHVACSLPQVLQISLGPACTLLLHYCCVLEHNQGLQQALREVLQYYFPKECECPLTCR